MTILCSFEHTSSTGNTGNTGDHQLNPIKAGEIALSAAEEIAPEGAKLAEQAAAKILQEISDISKADAKPFISLGGGDSSAETLKYLAEQYGLANSTELNVASGKVFTSSATDLEDMAWERANGYPSIKR